MAPHESCHPSPSLGFGTKHLALCEHTEGLAYQHGKRLGLGLDPSAEHRDGMVGLRQAVDQQGPEIAPPPIGCPELGGSAWCQLRWGGRQAHSLSPQIRPELASLGHARRTRKRLTQSKRYACKWRHSAAHRPTSRSSRHTGRHCATRRLRVATPSRLRSLGRTIFRGKARDVAIVSCNAKNTPLQRTLRGAPRYRHRR